MILIAILLTIALAFAWVFVPRKDSQAKYDYELDTCNHAAIIGGTKEED